LRREVGNTDELFGLKCPGKFLKLRVILGQKELGKRWIELLPIDLAIAKTKKLILLVNLYVVFNYGLRCIMSQLFMVVLSCSLALLTGCENGQIAKGKSEEKYQPGPTDDEDKQLRAKIEAEKKEQRKEKEEAIARQKELDDRVAKERARNEEIFRELEIERQKNLSEGTEILKRMAEAETKRQAERDEKWEQTKEKIKKETEEKNRQEQAKLQAEFELEEERISFKKNRITTAEAVEKLKKEFAEKALEVKEVAIKGTAERRTLLEESDGLKKEFDKEIRFFNTYYEFINKIENREGMNMNSENIKKAANKLNGIYRKIQELYARILGVLNNAKELSKT
jgi:hypothetical protein